MPSVENSQMEIPKRTRVESVQLLDNSVRRHRSGQKHSHPAQPEIFRFANAVVNCLVQRRKNPIENASK